ncbi:MAG: polysaccharide biosynthesis/export family protein [Opitutaceae bacterium]
MKPFLSLPGHVVLAAFLAIGWTAPAFGQGAPANADAAASYRLNLRDQIEVQIFDEPELSTIQRIDGRGQVRIQLVGTVALAGKTVREAEDFVETLYVEKRILKNPMATVRVIEYAPREVNVLGEVATPGALPFPPEINEMDIVDVIAKAGGFTQIARRNRVEVTRLGSNGKVVVSEINVEDLIRGRGEGVRFMVRPGDTISVPAVLF